MAVLEGNLAFPEFDDTWPFPPQITYSPTLVTISLSGGFSVWSYHIWGEFDQAGDGAISGTVTSMAGFFSTDAIDFFSPFTNLDFTLAGLNADYAMFQDALLQPQTAEISAEAILLAGDDILYDPWASGYAGDDLLYGSAEFADLLNGGDGNDTIESYGADGQLIGGAGEDHMTARGQNGHFEGGAGDDVINAWDASFLYFDPSAFDQPDDVAAYQGMSSGYTLSLSRETVGAVTVADHLTERDGTDQLRGIDELAFSKGALDLGLYYRAATLSTPEMIELATLYIAYFDRAPDATGLYYWAAPREMGMSLEEVSRHFLNSQENQARTDFFGPAEDTVKAVYENVLNRVPEAEGLAFWTAMLQEDLVDRSAFTLEIIRGALSDPVAGEDAALTAQRAVDRAYLTDKTNLGLYFATEKGMSDVANARAVLADFDGSAESVTAGRALVDGFYADAQDAETGELLIQMMGVLDDPFYI